MADSTACKNDGTNVWHNTKALLRTNFKVMLSLMLLSMSLSSLLQFANYSFINPFILVSFTLPYQVEETTADYFSFDFSIFYDVKYVRNLMISASIPYMLSFIVVVSIIYVLNMIYREKDSEFNLTDALKSLIASFITKLYITVIYLAYQLILLSICNLATPLSALVGLSVLFNPFLHAILLLGLIVSVCEKSSGVSALRRAMELFQSRRKLVYFTSFWWVEIIIKALYSVRYLVMSFILARVSKTVAVSVGVVRDVVSVIVFAMLFLLLVAVHIVLYFECKKSVEDEEIAIKDAEYTRLDNDSTAQPVL